MSSSIRWYTVFRKVILQTNSLKPVLYRKYLLCYFSLIHRVLLSRPFPHWYNESFPRLREIFRRGMVKNSCLLAVKKILINIYLSKNWFVFQLQNFSDVISNRNLALRDYSSKDRNWLMSRKKILRALVFW